MPKTVQTDEKQEGLGLVGGDRGLSLRQCHSEHMEKSRVAFVTVKLGHALARVSWAWFIYVLARFGGRRRPGPTLFAAPPLPQARCLEAHVFHMFPCAESSRGQSQACH